MSLPAEHSVPPSSVSGAWDGGGDPDVERGVGGGFVALDSRVEQDMRWCSNCGGPQIFVEVFEFSGGRVGFCFGCGEERVARFSRVTEAA
jgi:hypothetical protein